MANSIELRKDFSTVIDELYVQEAKTATLDENNIQYLPSDNSNEIQIPKLTMQGLGDYNRATGDFTNGDVSLSYETIKYNYDRSRIFTISKADNIETAGTLYMGLMNDFVKRYAVPEYDAFRIAALAAKDGINIATPASLDASTLIPALRVAQDSLDEQEVSDNDRILFITPTLYSLINDLDTTKSREILSEFAEIHKVPTKRFYTAIDLKDGKTAGEEIGGYIKDATNGKNINFMVVSKSAVITHTKISDTKIVTPEQNNTGDGWKFGFHVYGLAAVRDNGAVGIYLHNQAT